MKKRICFLADSIFSIGGVQRVTAVVATALSADYDVTILTFDNPATADLTLYHLNETTISYRFFAYPELGKVENTLCKAYSAFYQKVLPQSRWTSWLYGHSSFPPTLRRALTRELKAGHYHVIIGVHAPLAGRLATIKSQLPGVKTIGWVHNSFEALFGKQFHYIGAGRKRHYVYQFRRLDHVVLLCHHDADMYRAYDPLFTPTVIYNPLTLTPGLRSDGTSRRFLAVGRFSRQHKGFDLLIEAFHLFTQHNSQWTLDIVGEGREEDMLRGLIHKYQLESRVTIHPFTTDIQQYYSQAQVYVLSSRWEGFGLVLVEAMAHGLPVVSSDLPTSQEIMGDFGLYFKNGDISALAQQLEAATRLDWPSVSAEALEVARRFDINHIIEHWKTLID
jgi:glycosyltransferase involved in cell wall biosynthesis